MHQASPSLEVLFPTYGVGMKFEKPVSNDNSVWDETGLNDAGLETGSVTGSVSGHLVKDYI